ncbi:MAG: glucose/galactose MFS transporter, partial [Flavobacteriales bacterium]
YWGGAMLGRFVGFVLMQRFSASKLLAVAALLAMSFIGMSIASVGVTALLLTLAVGFCNSIMFPTIFTLAIEDLGEAKPQGSGVLCTAIVGGAFIPPAMGALVDSMGFGWAFVLPMICYAYIAWYSGRLVPAAAG